MNRWDEIQATARDIASNIHSDHDHRNQMADDLIRLVCLVVKAAGKGVAVAGESAMNGPDSEADAGGERYLVGEDLQQAAEKVQEGSVGADLERYERSGLKPVWQPDPAKRAAAFRFAPGASQDCPFLPGEAIPACDFDPNCPTHGILGKTAATPVVSHAWVSATDDVGATLGCVHCGVCGVRKCDGGCGDPSVGATPDIDCTTHGNDQARQCVERCVGCGDPVDNGRAHGPNQGFGGCC